MIGHKETTQAKSRWPPLPSVHKPQQATDNMKLTLDHLNLRLNSIGDEGAGRLAGVLGQCRSLAHLDLSLNSIRDEGAGRLAGVLGQCRSLAHLHLNWTSISAEELGVLQSVETTVRISHQDLDTDDEGERAE